MNFQSINFGKRPELVTLLHYTSTKMSSDKNF